MAVTTASVLRRDGTIQLSVDQTVAGTDAAVIADPGDGVRIAVVSVFGSLDAAGTFKLLGGATNLTGTIDVGASMPFGFKGSVRVPFVECDDSEDLDLVTSGGAFSGVIIYRIVPGA